MLGLWLPAFTLVITGICVAQEPPENIALGASYSLTPPNYGYCTDPDDATQLTDGVYSTGYFWTQKTTVGWSGGAFKFVTIDLGEVFPISGLSFNTAAGVAEVRWPKHILIFVSDDGAAWHEVGDLVELVGLGALPEYGTYAVRKLVATDLDAHGRYVQFAIEGGGPYVFVDEIEVYRGPDDLLAAELPGDALTDVPAHLKARAFGLLIKDQLHRDLQAAREDIAAPGLPDDRRAALTAEADGLAARIASMARIGPEGFRAVLPMTELERDIFAMQARVWRAQGKPGLRIWKSHRWDYLAPSDEPDESAEEPGLAVRMMNGEVRADALNLTNAAEQPVKARLRIAGLPGGTNPKYLTVREVLHVGTRRFVSVAAAMPEARREGDDYVIEIPSGMTVQAWFEFAPGDLEAGEHRGELAVRSQQVAGVGDAQPTGPATQLRVPISLTISPITFPAETRLLVGGWSYTDSETQYGITPENREALIEYLREHRVNAPWATSAAMPWGEYDDAGNMIQDPDTDRFDAWVTRWPGARLYMIYLARGDWAGPRKGGDSVGGAATGTEEFGIVVGEWAHFWAQHMRDLGLQPSQLGLLAYDEPHDEKGYGISEEWARAIQAAEPDLVLFVDPQPREAEGPLAMMEQMDVLCPHRPQWLQSDWFEGFFADQRESGRDLWFYSAAGPARSFDPFSYYLMQSWHCFAIGGKGSCFWAFADDGRVSVWNEYDTDGRGPYCPMYLDENSVTTGKWFEAIREGAQDYEYLAMLRDRIGELEAEGRGGEEIAAAKELLREGPRRVMAQEEKLNYTWDQEKDRGIADRVRYEVLDALEGLRG